MHKEASLSQHRGMGARMSNRAGLARRKKTKAAGLAIGTNDFLWSEDFARHAWGQRFYLGGLPMPDLSADTSNQFGLAHDLLEDAANSQHGAIMAFTDAAENAPYLQWALVKAAGRNFQMSGGNADANNYVNYDLGAGQLYRGSTIAVDQAGMIDKGNGWFVVWAVMDTDGIAYMHVINNAATAAKFQAYQGVAGQGVVIAAIQREALGVTAPMGYAMTTNAAV